MTSALPAVPTESAALPSGAAMPLLGFGTWQIKGDDAVRATAWALEAGYRHLDTATVYGNEKEVGAALRDSGVSRDDVFVTTKVPPAKAGSERDTLAESLALLGTAFVDLWLIHWPAGKGADTDMWRALVAAREEGLVRDIGVSNYSLAQVDELEQATGVLPAINQIEWSPLLFDRSVLDGHRSRGVVLEGYSALRGGTLEHPVVTGIASRLERTPAQVIVRWHLEHGVVVIPKSREQERIAGNADVGGFALSEDDVAALDALGPAA
jgi:2,5-diketo-D-gluconate reductase A